MESSVIKDENIVKRAYLHEQEATHLSVIVSGNIILAEQNRDLGIFFLLSYLFFFHKSPRRSLYKPIDIVDTTMSEPIST